MVHWRSCRINCLFASHDGRPSVHHPSRAAPAITAPLWEAAFVDQVLARDPASPQDVAFRWPCVSSGAQSSRSPSVVHCPVEGSSQHRGLRHQNLFTCLGTEKGTSGTSGGQQAHSGTANPQKQPTRRRARRAFAGESGQNAV